MQTGHRPLPPQSDHLFVAPRLALDLLPAIDQGAAAVGVGVCWTCSLVVVVVVVVVAVVAVVIVVVLLDVVVVVVVVEVLVVAVQGVELVLGIG